jgi:hypothetical protein
MSRERAAAIGKAAAIGTGTPDAITVELSSLTALPRRISTTTVGRIIPPIMGTTIAGQSATYAALTVAFGSAIDPFACGILARQPLLGGLTASDRRIERNDQKSYQSYEMVTRHARPCAGHPRLILLDAPKTWMAGTSPAMTACVDQHQPALVSLAGRASSSNAGCYLSDFNFFLRCARVRSRSAFSRMNPSASRWS